MGSAPVIRLLIVDDHALVRSGLRRLLERQDAIRVEAEAGNADQAVRLSALHQPDVVLLDVVMPGCSGLDAIPAIRKAAPAARVLMLSMDDDACCVRAAFAAGASGYLTKAAADTELVTAVRKVAAGRQYVNAALGATLAASQAETNNPERARLSEGERQVMRLLAFGHTNHEIAAILQISIHATEKHRARIMRELQLASRAELVRHALQLGLLKGSDN